MSETVWYDLAIRVDTSDSRDLDNFLVSDGGNFIGVSEKEGTNPHVHVYLRTKRKANAIRVALKRAIPGLNGNGSYSVALCRDVDKYLRYMMKGESDSVLPIVIFRNGIEYTDEWVKVTHDEYWSVNEELHRRRKLLPVAEVVLAQCKKDAVRWSDAETIGKIYIRELVFRDKAINIFSVKSHIALIQCKLCPDDSAIEYLATKLY